MEDKAVTIFSENPEEDIWKHLLRYTYKASILKYFKGNFNDTPIDQDRLCEKISASILQAHEYFRLSKNASLHISPLLLYYGCINLAQGTALLLTGKDLQICGHGMKAFADYGNSSVGSTTIQFFSPKDGGINVFLKEIEQFPIILPELDSWSLQDILMSIPELTFESTQCYEGELGFCFSLHKVVTEERTVEKLSFDNLDKKTITGLLSEIPNFSKAYLNPVFDNTPPSTTILLNRKYLSDSISVESYTGQSYLLRGHMNRKQLVLLPQWAYMYIALFALSSLCRYEPHKWNPFIRLDESGERLLIEKFLTISRRLLPNFFISSIEKCNYQFENRKYQPENKVKILGAHEIKDLIHTEIIQGG